jgi:hypothetical protein
MDTVEVTLRLDRPLAERLRDPGERARYEAFLELVANAASQADVKEAVRLLTATPGIRQRRLKRGVRGYSSARGGGRSHRRRGRARADRPKAGAAGRSSSLTPVRFCAQR